MCQTQKTSNYYPFKQFNGELNDFYKYLKDNQYTDEEIKKIFQPLTDQILNSSKKSKTIFFFLLLLTFGLVVYLLTYSETISWHLLAIGRIFMIKSLPYWDWTTLKNEQCLLGKFATPAASKEVSFNCELCELIGNIPTQLNIDGNALKELYLDLHVPLILTGEYLEDWPKSVEDFLLVITDDVIYQSMPCYLSTNIHDTSTPNSVTLGKIVDKSQRFQNFFFHLQNCEFQTMKQFRSWTPRPEFLPFELSPIQYNWLLWNKNYNITNYKQINLIEKYTIIGQIVGSNYYKLMPRNNCKFVCKIIEADLGPGQFLIFSSLWNLEYKPGEEGENIAVILEAH